MFFFFFLKVLVPAGIIFDKTGFWTSRSLRSDSTDYELFIKYKHL